MTKIINRNGKAYKVLLQRKILIDVDKKIKRIKKQLDADIVMRKDNRVRFLEKIDEADYEEVDKDSNNNKQKG